MSKVVATGSHGIARRVSRARAERLVATVRTIAHAVAALAAAVTARIDGDDLPLLILLPWLAVSAALLFFAIRSGQLYRPPLLLALDLAVMSVVVAVTGGGASPFFAFLLLTPFGASLLYGRRGMLWAGCGTLAAFIGIVAATGRTAADPRLVIVRAGVLVLIAVVMIRRAVHEQRTNADLENLASWPSILTAGREAGVRTLLEHAAATLRVRQVVLTWCENDGSEHVARLVECGPAASTPAGGVPFTSQTARGQLLALDPRAADPDDLRLAEIVARLVSAGLDQINLLEMMREGAANDERMRLSRDLHDGLLQSLGGLALHARGARRTAASDPRGTEQQLDLIVGQLIEAQRALRDFVDRLRPGLMQSRDSLRVRLMRIARSVELQWNVPVDFDAARELDAVGGRLADDVAALAAEALANAARHAAATRIRGSASVDGESVRIDIADDGRGFPFHGRLELPQLIAGGVGPWSIKERVSVLRGDLAIESSPRGARVEIRLPAAAEAA
jgi:signal transduction histidine kinase